MPNVSRPLRSPIRNFITSFALALLGMTGCTLNENHEANDPSILPANRYAGKSCDEILTSIGDELNAQRDSLNGMSSEPNQVEAFPQGPWQATCEVFDYRAIRVDSMQLSCPTNGVDIEHCNSLISKILFVRPKKQNNPLQYSGIYEVQCQYVFSDGSRTKQISRFGMILNEDCPDTSPGIADDTQAPGPMP